MVSDFKRRGYLTLTCVTAALVRNSGNGYMIEIVSLHGFCGLEADERVANRGVDSSRHPHAAYVSDLERDQVRRAVERLPQEFGEIMLLREYEELSYEQIATMPQCPVGTVMSRLARARTKLGDLLAAAVIATMEGRRQRKGRHGEGTLDESPTLVERCTILASLPGSGIFSSLACFVVGTAAPMPQPF